ncbi:MAG TPA: PEGA domain-containing protein [Polyangiaceae bacterium]|nr:PEGA domain-containing protein [Polyangiaceae bacterium]
MRYEHLKMGYRRQLHRLLGVALVLASALPLRAEPAPEQIKVARKRFQEGVAAADARNYEGARLAFQQAYALKPHPSVLRNLGQAELKTGHYLDAARHLSTFIRDTTFGTPSERESAKKSLAEAETKIGRLILEVDVPAAEIAVDGEMSGRSPLGADPIYVEPGQRVVRVQKDGYDVYEQTQSFEPDRVIRLKVSLRANGPVPTEAASVSRTSPTLIEPVIVPAAADRSHTAPPTSFPTAPDRAERGGIETRTIVLISGAGLTALAAGFGVGLTLQGASLDDDAATQRAKIAQQFGSAGCSVANATQRACVQLDETLGRRNRANGIAQGAFIAAGVLGAATVVSFLLWPRSQTSVTPYAGIGPAGDGALLGIVGQY